MFAALTALHALDMATPGERLPAQLLGLTVIRHLANWQYGCLRGRHRDSVAGACQRPASADPGMAEAPEGAFPGAGRRRSCRRRGVRGADRRKAGREPADRQRAPEGSVASPAAALQTRQAV